MPTEAKRETVEELRAQLAGSKTMIVSHIWDYSFDTGTNAVDVLVYRLRDKIDRGFEPKLLHTVRGVGYVLKVG